MKLKHPSEISKPEWTEIIRNEAGLAEIERKLTNRQLQLVLDNDWFKLLTPKQNGDSPTNLQETLLRFEAIAWADACVGLVVGLCAGASWLSAFIDSELCNDIFDSGEAIFACCRASTGTAEIVDGGYLVNGKWLHATGSAHATFFIGNCIVTQNGIPVTNEDNKLTVMSFVFYKNEINPLPTWNSIGMIASSSYGFEVADLIVTEKRSFNITASDKTGHPTHLFPFVRLIETILAINISGMTIHFLDLCESLFKSKLNSKGIPLIEDIMVQGHFDRLKRKFEAARVKLFYLIDMTWKICLNEKVLTAVHLSKISMASGVLTSVSREVVNELFPYCGLHITQDKNELNRVWRDFTIASQHSLLVFGGWS